MDITPSGAVVKAPTNAPVLSDADFEAQLEALAQEIEHQERTAIFKISLRLAKAHELFLYRRDEGGFQGWVERRLNYSRSHAYRLLDVDKFVKAKASQGWDTFGTLPVSAIYRLAAPSTPEQACDNILDRLKAGERLSCAAVDEAITGEKQRLGIAEIKTEEYVDGGHAAQHDGGGRDYHNSGAIEPDGDDGGGRDHHNGGAVESGTNAAHAGENDDQHASGEDDPCAHAADMAANGTVKLIKSTGMATDISSKLSVEAWHAANSEADEVVKIEIIQSEPLETLLGRMSETQKEKLFDRLVALQIRQAKPASKSADDMFKSITGTFWYAASQDDPQKITEALAVINGKLKNRQLTAKDVKLVAVNRERAIPPTVMAAAAAARENLKRRKH